MPRRLTAVLLAAGCLLFGNLPADLRAAEPQRRDWSEFRGPDGNGISLAAGLPLTWSETENVAWKTPIHGKGWSSPVILDNQIWMTTATEDGKDLSAICVDLATGAVLHDVIVFHIAEPMYCHSMNSYATPTPVVDDGRVYVHFGSAGTACLDSVTAKTLWARQDLPCDHFRGPGSSPIAWRDRLFINFDGFDFQYVVALDKQTGRTLWKTDRTIDYGTDNGDAKKAYCTDTVVDVDGQAQLVSPAAMATVAYDPETGAELWTVKHGGFNAAARPFYAEGLIYLCTEGGYRLCAVRPNGSGDVTETHVAWKYSRSTPTRPSQLVQEGLFYMVSDKGVASCLEAATGESVWTDRIAGPCSASPVAADGRIYFFDEEGTSVVIAPGRELKILAENRLAAGCMASPAVVDGSLIIRTKGALYRIQETVAK